MLESAARAGIGRGKPCGLVITAFAVIFVSDIVLLIVYAFSCRDVADYRPLNELLLQATGYWSES